MKELSATTDINNVMCFPGFGIDLQAEKMTFYSSICELYYINLEANMLCFVYVLDRGQSVPHLTAIWPAVLHLTAICPLSVQSVCKHVLYVCSGKKNYTKSSSTKHCGENTARITNI